MVKTTIPVQEYAQFSIELGPSSLFERVRYEMKSVHRLIPYNTHFFIGIPDEIKLKVKKFNIKEWKLVAADVSRENGRFCKSTWEYIFLDDYRYWLTIENGNIARSIVVNKAKKENYIQPDDDFYKYVDKVNQQLMKSDKEKERILTQDVPNEAVRNELLSEFDDPIYKSQTLIDIFLKDPIHIQRLAEKKKFSAKAKLFFEIESKKLKSLRSINDDNIRNIKANEIIDEFFKIPQVKFVNWATYEKNLEHIKRAKYKKEEQKKQVLREAEERHERIERDNKRYEKLKKIRIEWTEKYKDKEIRCPYDKRYLMFSTIKINRVKGGYFCAPVFKCPLCYQAFMVSDYFKTLQMVRLPDGSVYRNINPKDINPSKKTVSVEWPIEEKTKQNSKTPSKDSYNKNSIKPVDINLRINKKYNCYTYLDVKPTECVNNECKSAKLVGCTLIINGKRYTASKCEKCGSLYIKAGLYRQHSNLFTRLHPVEKAAPKINVKQTGSDNQKIEELKITSADVIVRGNTFRCIRQGHQIDPIVAIVPIINSEGIVVERKTTAGYCRKCKIFFIRESIYRSLKRSGIIACRVKEEDVYYHKNKGLYNNLAEQSPLMEYGYSVSSTQNISEIRRHKILSILIDNKIMQPSEIINYLEFFISQREKQKKNYTAAINKWSSDIAFVKQYSSGKSKMQVKVKSIKHSNYHSY